MEEYPLNQSAKRRAWGDTRHSFHTIKFFLGVEVVTMGVFIFGATLLIPENASKLISAGYPAVGAMIGAIVGFGIIYLTMLVIAPYKQRNEARALLLAKPKPIPLQNPKELRGAIASVEQRTLELVQRQDELDNMTAESPNVVNTVVVSRVDEAFGRWNESMNELHRQYLIAGDAYEMVCLDLTGFIWLQVTFKMGRFKPPKDHTPLVLQSVLLFAGELAGRIRGLLRKIDEVSGQALDKEGSLT